MAIAPDLIPAPVETVTPVKPSEYLRLGSMLVPHLTGRLTEVAVSPDGANLQVTAACALGTMGVAAGYTTVSHETGTLFLHWDGRFDETLNLLKATFTTEKCGCGSKFMSAAQNGSDLFSRIIHLNDTEGWSRPEIADWLEGMGL